MGLFDALFGQSKPPQPKLDPLFALSTAAIAIETDLGWLPAGKAGLVLHPCSNQDYSAAEAETRELLELAARETGSEVEMQTDQYHYRWLLFQDPDWDDLVQLVHLAGQNLQEKGYGSQLLAAVFSFRREVAAPGRGRTMYLIFSYKRGRFYPFIPTSNQETRDGAEEMRVYALMERELPWEKNVEYWYPLWGCPV